MAIFITLANGTVKRKSGRFCREKGHPLIDRADKSMEHRKRRRTDARVVAVIVSEEKMVSRRQCDAELALDIAMQRDKYGDC
jgi:hypothetical protein